MEHLNKNYKIIYPKSNQKEKNKQTFSQNSKLKLFTPPHELNKPLLYILQSYIYSNKF